MKEARVMAVREKWRGGRRWGGARQEVHVAVGEEERKAGGRTEEEEGGVQEHQDAHAGHGGQLTVRTDAAHVQHARQHHQRHGRLAHAKVALGGRQRGREAQRSEWGVRGGLGESSAWSAMH